MKTALVLMLKNLAGMLMTQTMVLWALTKWAEYTDNLIDDNVVLIVKGAFKNDVELVKQGIAGLSDALKKDGEPK